MILVLFTLGLIVGSFLNVLVIRHGTGKGLGGRSGCMSCGYQLKWYDLVPVLSWLYLGGKCRSCGTRISLQYPLVEAATGVAFAVIGPLVFGPGLVHAMISLSIVALLVAICSYDFRHTIIPDAWVYTFIILTLGYQLTAYSVQSTATMICGPSAVSCLLSAPLAALPLFLLWAVSHGRWMGFGDVKLSIGIGFLLGSIDGLYAVMLAFMIGGIVSAPLLFLSSTAGQCLMHSVASSRSRFAYTMRSEIPFGPFLVLATCIIWCCNLIGISISLW